MFTKNNSTSAEKTKGEQASWPDFAVGLYGKLSGRGSKINYEFEDLDIFIPAKIGESDHFHWRLNGRINISTQDQVNQDNNE